MYDGQEERLKEIAEKLEQVAFGKKIDPLSMDKSGGALESILVPAINGMFAKLSQSAEFLQALSQGNLDIDPPPRNQLIAPFKQIHANLRHLVWQTEQVAAGDLSQRVDFLGSFSDAFNRMIDSLREKRVMEKALEEANRAIIESIDYANTIQQAFLPTKDDLNVFFSRHFLLWMPRDVIGGDMIKCTTKNDKVILGLMDCTGHGVPGAMMAMMAGACFDRVVAEIDVALPSAILIKLNQLVKSALNQHHQHSMSNDGLDMGLCIIDKRLNKLSFCGAKIPLFISDNGMVTEIASNRISLGYRSSPEKPKLQDYVINYHPNMYFYMTSDGLVDQIGGQRGFPLGKTAFTNFLVTLENTSDEYQNDALAQFIMTYRCSEPQLDDFACIGFKP